MIIDPKGHVRSQDAADLEYKYVIRDSNGGVAAWKPGSNYYLQLAAHLRQRQDLLEHIRIQDAWDGLSDIQIQWRPQHLVCFSFKSLALLFKQKPVQEAQFAHFGALDRDELEIGMLVQPDSQLCLMYSRHGYMAFCLRFTVVCKLSLHSICLNQNSSCLPAGMQARCMRHVLVA